MTCAHLGNDPLGVRTRMCGAAETVFECKHPENVPHTCTTQPTREKDMWCCAGCVNDTSVVKIRAKSRARQQIERGEIKVSSVNGPGVIVIDSQRHGAGDAITMAWASEGSKSAVPRLVHYALGEKRELLEMLGQECTDDRANAMNTFGAYREELALRGHPSRVVQRSRALGILTDPKRPSWRIPEHATAWAAANVKQGAVLLFPNVMWRTREWPPDYWIELHQRLKQRYDVYVMGGDADGRYKHLSGYSYGTSWPLKAAAMLRAAVVVCNDSGPMHLAGTLNVPTLALFGPSTREMCSWMPSVRPLAADPAEIRCVGCYFNAPYNLHICNHGCVALSHLTPDVVERHIDVIAHQAQ